MKLIFATHNSNKFKEVREMMPDSVELIPLKAIGCTEEIEENGESIAENAQIKADYVQKNYNLSCFADDTGLEVDALNGAPGVFSARYAGEEKNDTANMDLLLKNLSGKTNRDAQFKTVIALNFNGKVKTFTGICRGTITPEKSGKKGFGYDPIFQPEGYSETFAEMSAVEKGKISHRGIALRKLVEFLKIHF